jgi:hypothetical protein
MPVMRATFRLESPFELEAISRNAYRQSALDNWTNSWHAGKCVIPATNSQNFIRTRKNVYRIRLLYLQLILI